MSKEATGASAVYPTQLTESDGAFHTCFASISSVIWSINGELDEMDETTGNNGSNANDLCM